MPDRSRTWIAVAGVAAGAVVLRALALSGTELYSDEAYYWLWSLRPGAGYYDHPPAVAWLVRAGTAVAGGELGVRLLSLACGGLTVGFAALLARELSDDPRAPLWGALLVVSAPLLHLLGALALPDGPLVASYTAALWLVARARGVRWVAAGAAVGLALLSKYTAALLAPGLLLLLALDPDLRAEARTRWPWLGAAVALLVFAPCLLWNARHGWVSLGFQLEHGFGRNASWDSFLEFVGGQVAAAGPVALVLGGWFLARPRSVAARRTAAGVLVPLAVMVFSATRGKVEANWPALVYPALAASAAALILREVRYGRLLVVGAAALSGAALVAFGIAQHEGGFLVGTPILDRFHGWRDTAREVARVAAEECPALGCDPRQPRIVAMNYQYAAELAFYGGFRRFAPGPERPSQLDLWYGPPPADEPFFLVGYEGMNPAYREVGGGRAEGRTRLVPVWYRGHVLRTVSVTPYARVAAADGGRSR